MTKQYAQRDIESLDGYMTHVMAMTAEQLHSKSDIAGELAWRDSQIDALQQKLDAMAAENAALMKFCKNAAFDADYESELGMERGGFTDAVNDVKTPVTDAYMNSVRAEGVEMFAKHCDDSIGLVEPEDEELSTLMEEQARNYAASLRSGAHDTADKAD